MENIINSEICKKCGQCCRNYPYVELTQHEVFELEKLTGLHSDAFTNKKSVDEYFLDFKDNGDCIFLNGDSGDYSCGVYVARSAICRNYPQIDPQNDACYAHRKRISNINSGFPGR